MLKHLMKLWKNLKFDGNYNDKKLQTGGYGNDSRAMATIRLINQMIAYIYSLKFRCHLPCYFVP